MIFSNHGGWAAKRGGVDEGGTHPPHLEEKLGPQGRGNVRLFFFFHLRH